MMVGKNIKMRQPSFGCRKYKRISKKKATSPMFSATSSFAVKGNQQSQPSNPNPGPSQSQSGQTPRLSDVPCYTCRRRHVKCDRILPHCAKCAKKGVTCLGYRKPLRWAEGVAVRGKLKGKAQPVVDSETLSTSRAILDQSRAAVRTEAAQYGSAPLTLEGEEASVDAIRLRVIHYFNTVMCAKHVEAAEHPLASDRLANLTPELARALPKDLLNCIITISAIHMSIRHPGNSAVTRLALEMKNELFEGINNAFLQPQSQRADVLFICIALMFAMELVENGNPARWGPHYNGGINLIILHGGLKRFASYYPHLKTVLAALSQMQVMLININAAPLEFVNLISRNDLKSICFDPKVRKQYFLSIPLRLLNANYDMAVCARNIFGNHDHRPSVADVYTREWVLADVLRFSPEDGMADVRNYMYTDRPMTEAEVQAWTMIFRAWRGAMAVVVLRHLYFGLPHAEMASNLSQASTPMMQAQTLGQDLSFSSSSELLQGISAPMTGYQPEEVVDSYFDLGRLSPEAHFSEPFSQTPSPLPSPRPSNETIEFDHWSRRYQLHNEAVSELCSNLTALVSYGHVSFIRHAIIPLFILSLVSRSGTFERAASIDVFDQFTRYMASMASIPNPIGGPPMELNIPWDRLDAFSAEVEQQRYESIIYVEDELHNSAPEWNWRYMLQRTKIDTAWPCTAGGRYMELGQEFWAFGVLEQCCNEEVYAAFSQRPAFESSV